MRCTNASLAVLALLAGCASPPELRVSVPPPAAAPTTASGPSSATRSTRPPAPAPAQAEAAAPSPARSAAPPATAPAPPAVRKGPPRVVKLGPPATPRSEAELRVQIATRLVQAHPDSTYLTPAPDPLLAIPVIEIELNADGSVRATKVLREPRQEKQTVRMAIDAIHRAAPYGNVSRLPKPWKVVEVFLFDDELRFKPRTLDLAD